ncbi:cdc2 [Trichosporon asahii var. asahii CBS 2479]|uniref:Cdc2 n=1 Tax=Trichosporon asahii var. asahii (strain ATCC 90039 / CBS 2479 / JCM 2466 / KCTC 7840 / NBRC 103889/ NCYC 2677 / UAMH 7654) TaxID=1186058 RepID=J5SKI9_TRIAS|nr:cdc2 [Trichosporon asahii var. asahii CBS 2479]EJT46111.1 cdc2 [Trichosporon asahii var. asahii CBS 2479]
MEPFATDIFFEPSGDTPASCHAVKIVTAPKDGVDASRRPHNVIREVRILRRATHPNIIPLLEYSYSEPEHRLTFPLLPVTMANILEHAPSPEIFAHTALGLLSALEHLHSLDIAHRDVKPANIMYSWDGTVQLIDFGTAWDGQGGDGGAGMETQVGSGHYRAPELLFSETYDPRAIDLWSAGVTLAECFNIDLGADSDSSDSDDEIEGFQLRRPPPRKLLFSAEFGEIGLAGSIFRVLGTPTEENWPLMFDPKPPRRLRDVLDVDEKQSLVIEGLVQLEAGRRLSAKDALALLPPAAEAEEQARPVLKRWIDHAEKKYEKLL